MKIQIQNYTFDASAKTITFTGYTSIILERIYLVENVTRGIKYYTFNKRTTDSVTTNVLTLAYDTTAHDDADKLAIFYDDPLASEHIQGNVAHDDADAGNPVGIGGLAHASATPPTPVGNGDRVKTMHDSQGRVVTTNSPDELLVDGLATLTTTSDADIIAAPGSGKSIVLESLTLSNTSATPVRVDVKNGTTIWRSFFLAASGGGATWNGKKKLATNAALKMALSTNATDIRAGADGHIS
jgi:hypothetical protein